MGVGFRVSGLTLCPPLLTGRAPHAVVRPRGVGPVRLDAAATAAAPAPTPPDRRGPELRPCDSLPPLLLVSRGVTVKKSFPRGRLQGGGSDQTSPQRRGSDVSPAAGFQRQECCGSGVVLVKMLSSFLARAIPRF